MDTSALAKCVTMIPVIATVVVLVLVTVVLLPPAGPVLRVTVVLVRVRASDDVRALYFVLLTVVTRFVLVTVKDERPT